MKKNKGSKNNSNQQNRDYPSRLVIGFVIVIEILVLALLTHELIASQFRATDRVLILVGISFLPVLAEMIKRLASGSNLINLKAGDLEIKIQGIVEEKVEHKAKSIAQDFEGKLSTAEQTLYPLVGGPNIFAQERLAEGNLIISSKNFAGNIVVVKLLIKHLENHGFRCQEIIPIGGTLANYAALINGWVDVIVDYTGTGCLFLNIDHRGKSEDEILKLLNQVSEERFQCRWLVPLGTKTNYCIVMKDESPIEKKIINISDLRMRGSEPLLFGTNYEFMNRRDGFPGLKDCYSQLRFEPVVCSYAERYNFLIQDKADVAIGHTTDPEISSLNLKILVDDQKFFPNYFEVPIARIEALETVEGLEKSLIKFAELGITEDDLATLIKDYNYNPLTLNETIKPLLSSKHPQSK
jgi:glycine betaine/choline ABC-type transport system substrate-binding protein